MNRLFVAAISICLTLGSQGTQAQVFDCGGAGQRYCQASYFMNDSVISGDPYCNAGLLVTGAKCDIDRQGWPTKSLDMSRTWYVTGQSCGGTTNVSCWRLDDEVRDSLDMDASHLNHVTVLSPGGTLPTSGRFIFVYRASDSKLVMRRYDRSHPEGDPTLTACLGYANYRYEANVRPAKYEHVRHTQLNGGWSAVYCAGELTVKSGSFWRLNNASGHYQPSPACLDKVQATLQAYGYPFSSDFQKGAHNDVHATEEACPPPPSPNPGPDDTDHDEL